MDDDDLLTALVPWAPEHLARWNEHWRSDLLRTVGPDLALVGDTSWGAAVRDAVGLAVPDPLDWANRVVELPSGGWALTGIRFRGRDVSKPFVDVIATSVRPDAAGLAELGSVLEDFRAFSPLCFRVRLPGTSCASALWPDTGPRWHPTNSWSRGRCR